VTLCGPGEGAGVYLTHHYRIGVSRYGCTSTDLLLSINSRTERRRRGGGGGGARGAARGGGAAWRPAVCKPPGAMPGRIIEQNVSVRMHLRSLEFIPSYPLPDRFTIRCFKRGEEET
jgi:hypothetical protein